MKRAAVVYIFITLFCGAGLWGILVLGSAETAPPDLAGKWTLKPALTMGSAMGVEQSGRFFQISFDGGAVLKLTLAQRQGNHLKLAGQGFTLLLDLSPGEQDMELHLAGQPPQDCAAHRILRTYPLEPGNPGGNH